MLGSLNVKFAVLVLNCRELKWERESHVKNVVNIASCLKPLNKSFVEALMWQQHMIK